MTPLIKASIATGKDYNITRKDRVNCALEFHFTDPGYSTEVDLLHLHFKYITLTG